MKQKTFTKILLTFVLICFFTSPASSQKIKPAVKVNSGSWELLEPVPVPIVLSAGVSANGKFYLIGGTTTGPQKISSVYVYNPDADSWSKETDLPYAADAITAAEYENKIYALSGYGQIGNVYYHLNLNSCFDINNNVWTYKTNIPSPPRHGAVSVTLNDAIYLIGGNYNSDLNIVDVYSPQKDSWRSGTQMNIRRSAPAAAVYDGKIYVFGGFYQPTGSLSSMEIYDPATNSWSFGAEMPTAKFGARAECVYGIIYLFGGAGYHENTYLPSVEAYNPTTNTWMVLPDMPYNYPHCSSCEINGSIYVAGGYDGGKYYNSLSVFSPDDPGLVISEISADSAYIGQDILIKGFGFGDTQGSSYVMFGSKKADRYFSWTNTQIFTEVPENATSCNISVIRENVESNGMTIKIIATTSISPANELNSIPDKIDIKPNFPNPFNPSTTIKFSVPEFSFARIEVFDLSGRFIKSLVNSHFERGIHQCTWDGSDNSGKQAASGQYIARISGKNNYSDSIKITYLK